ncbi:MAG: thermostable hemolysin [Alphaproteobacteria bacterium]|nr:thermostable hemolysin [Alphaproteobacteria bacterium]
MILQLIRRDHPLRPMAEARVRAVYREAYGAKVRGFPDLLAAYVDAAGKPTCVAGVRYGLTDCFSEQYLDGPADVVLSGVDGRPVGRAEILEVTTLVGQRSAESLRLVRSITSLGRSLGMRWGLFTATAKLRRALPRLGMTLVELAPARRDRAAHPEDWGSYYETDPWVCAMSDRVIAPTIRPVTPRAAPTMLAL